MLDRRVVAADSICWFGIAALNVRDYLLRDKQFFLSVRRRFDVPGEMPLQDGGYGQDERISTAVGRSREVERGGRLLDGRTDEPLSAAVSRSCNALEQQLKRQGITIWRREGNFSAILYNCHHLVKIYFCRSKVAAPTPPAFADNQISRAYHLQLAGTLTELAAHVNGVPGRSAHRPETHTRQAR